VNPQNAIDSTYFFAWSAVGARASADADDETRDAITGAFQRREEGFFIGQWSASRSNPAPGYDAVRACARHNRSAG
jgi:hypothetical protein